MERSETANEQRVEVNDEQIEVLGSWEAKDPSTSG